MGGKVLNRQSEGFDIRREKAFLAATAEKTRAKVTQNVGKRSFNWKSDGFTLRKLKEFESRNGGRDKS